MYRVDRIGGAAELPGTFTPPDGFDPVTHVLQTLTLGAWTHRTEMARSSPACPGPSPVRNPPALVAVLAEHVTALNPAVARSHPAP